VADFGEASSAWLANVGWRRDKRDSAYAPSRGTLNTANLEVTLPVLDLRYARATYNSQWFIPLSRDYTLALNGDIGMGWNLGGTAYPLFKNFYAGGIGTVRGYYQSSLGPRDSVDNTALGGQSRLVGSAEFLFPLPGTGQDRSFRSFVFFDAGNVFPDTSITVADLRYSTGFGVNWASPIGPLKLSVGFPLRSEPGDRIQRFQFQVGSGF
jgi:outer membrane protein insertion porin family